MNKAYLLTLVSDQIKTVDVTFDHSVAPTKAGLKTYTYMTLLDDLKPGDEVIVEAGEDLKVVQVVRVHEDPEIDPTSNINYKWAISTKGSGVLAERDRLHQLEDEAVRQIKKAQKTAQRKKLREEFKEYIGGEAPKINFLEDTDS